MTEKQFSFLKKLAVEKNQNFSIAITGMTVEDASKLISEWIKLPKIKTVYLPQITDGMYFLEPNRIVKVQRAVHSSGNLYAKELIDGSFQYVPGLVSKLSPAQKMSIEQAKQFGKLYGICCCCGRTLTDEFSISNGIGPICAGKYF